MRRAILTLAGLALLAAGPARAENYKVGDKVVIIHDDVEVKVRDDVVDKVGRGFVFVVREVQGESIEISNGKPGFIEKQHVIPFAQAIDYWSGVIRSNPKDAGAYLARAYAWGQLKELDKEIGDYGEILLLEPTNWTAYYRRGLTWMVKQKYDAAIEDFMAAMVLDFEDARAFRMCGAALFAKGEFDKAIAHYDLAIRKDSRDAIAYEGRGRALRAKYRYDKAIDDFNDAIRIDPNYALAYLDRGEARKWNEEYGKAINDFDEAIRLDPKYALAYDYRAWLWATCPDARYRDGKKAFESATRACELANWAVEDHIDTLAAACAEVGDFDAAVKWQTKAIEMYTQHFPAEIRQTDRLGGRGVIFTPTTLVEKRSRLTLYRQRKPFHEEPAK